MMQKIEQKITGYKVVDKDSLTTEMPARTTT